MRLQQEELRTDAYRASEVTILRAQADLKVRTTSDASNHMRQILISRYGAPDVMIAKDAPSPAPAAAEVRIAVRAVGVNFADVLARVGLYPDAPKPPLVVGYEVAGTVDAVGTQVTRFAVGDRVVALTRFGGYASEALAPQAYVFPFHGDLSDAEAAALPVNY